MIIYTGADHRGFRLKEEIVIFLRDAGYSVSDLGNVKYDERDDYPDFARLVAEKVSADHIESKGIVICGSGVGVDIVANKYAFVRSALAFSTDQAMASRSDDDTNILALPADFLTLEQAKKIISVWLQTPFSGEDKYKRRIAKIRDIEIRRP